jgi:aminopeptidase N
MQKKKMINLCGSIIFIVALQSGLQTSAQNDLVNTRLDVGFDYGKHYLYGKEWVTLRPHLGGADSLYLDAKGMDIHDVSLIGDNTKRPLKYSYDGLALKIKLDKHHSPSQPYTVFLSYTAKPDELPLSGKDLAISGARGLYFINSDGKDKNEPVEIWTQGEPNGSSVWFPTIDNPDQKTLEEISMTVPAQYVTLSNGRLISQKVAGKGLRTDTWKMDKPHAPYLFMMAVGDFKIVEDKWKNTPVDYYLERAFAPYAKEIFGNTPEMIGFFSTKLGVPYPWNKYSQVVVRDYNNDGAMENTTATLLGESRLRTPREILDEDYGRRESSVAHELFHQWFGDYVTCENWGNLTVNESFGCFAETLWAEYKYGIDEGDAHIYRCMQQYLNTGGSDTKSLVRVNYEDVQALFDEVTYQKGACVLDMLRNLLGEETFYKGLNKYLVEHAFGNAGARQLEIAFEQASGKDLKWFFDQWYFRPGNPVLTVDYKWDEAGKTQVVYLQQTQEDSAFRLPLAIDVYVNGGRERHMIVMENKADTITFKVSSRPDLVNVDGDKILLVKKSDHKSIAEFVYQYRYAAKFVDRVEAISALAERQDSLAASQLLLAALKDKYYGLRILAIQSLDFNNQAVKSAAIPVLCDNALHDDNPMARASAISKLGDLKDSSNGALFTQALNDKSYLVEGAALNALAAIDTEKAMKMAKTFENDNKGELTVAMSYLYGYHGSEKQLAFVSGAFEQSDVDTRFEIAKALTILLARVDNTAAVDTSVETVKDLALKYNKFGVGKYAIKWLLALKKKKQDQAGTVDDILKEQLIAQINYISNSIEKIQNDRQ